MTIKFVISLDSALYALLNGWSGSRVESKLDQLLAETGAIRMKLEDFQAKIDQINANTTASAAAATTAATVAQSIKTQLDDLREQIKGMGLTEEQEAALLQSLDSAAAGTDAVKTANEALATFLQQTAASPTEPTPVEPVNV